MTGASGVNVDESFRCFRLGLQFRREVWAGGLDLVIRGGSLSKESTETKAIRKPVIKVTKSRK